MTENEQFYYDLLESLKQSPALAGAVFTEKDIAKNNITMKGIKIQLPGCSISPVLYPAELKECMKPGESLEAAANRFGREIAKEIQRESAIVQKNIEAF